MPYRIPFLLVACMVLQSALTSLSYAENIPINGRTATPRTLNHFVHFPVGYDPADTSTRYPLLIFFHGQGESGNASIKVDGEWVLDMTVLNQVLRHGPPKLIENGSWDDSLPFIVLSPQASGNTGDFHEARIDQVYRHAVANYPVDTDRVYVTGLSQGGHGTYGFIKWRPQWIAAAIPIAAWYPLEFDCAQIRHIGVWGFHGDNDGRITPNQGEAAINKVIDCGPVHPPKLTAYAGVQHNSWGRTYDNSMGGAYDYLDASASGTEHLGGDGIYYDRDIYRWLLSFSLSGTTPPNLPPMVDAGADQTLVLPQASVDLMGSASDSDGSIVSYQWSQVSGPAAVLADVTTPTLRLSGLQEGDSLFQLEVTDDAGATATDTARVSVLPEPPVPSPGSFLQFENRGWGYAYLHYAVFDGINDAADRLDLTGTGHDSLELHLKTLNGPLDYDYLSVWLTAGTQSREVPIRPYLGADSGDWMTVAIPLADFGFTEGKLELGIYRVGLRARGAFGSGEFGVDEIRFVGGGSPTLFYGDDRTASGEDDHLQYTTDHISVVARPDTGGLPQPNNAPQFDPQGDVVMDADETLTITLSGFDPDGDSIDFSATSVLPAFTSLTDHGDGTASLSLSPTATDAGSYNLAFALTDTADASDNLSFVLTVNATGGESQGYLTIENQGWGYLYLHYALYDGVNETADRLDITAPGHDQLTLWIRAVSGTLDYNNLLLRLTAGTRNEEVTLSTYATAIGTDWVRIDVPLADFAFPDGKLEQGIYSVAFRARGGFGQGQFGVDEIEFTGGAASTLFYGDDRAEAGEPTHVYSSTDHINIRDRPSSGGVGD